MPWQELSPMNLRMQFVTDWQSGCWTMTELCADYRISRKTGYKWSDRYDASGPRGLHDQSRRPHHSPGATDPAVVALLIALRTATHAGARRNSWPSRPDAIRGRPGRADRRRVTCSRRMGWSPRAATVRRARGRRWRRSPGSMKRGRRISRANFAPAMAGTATR